MTFQELLNVTVAERAAKKYSEKTIVMPVVSGNIIIVAEYFERMQKCDKFIAIKRKSSLKVIEKKDLDFSTLKFVRIPRDRYHSAGYNLVVDYGY